MKNDLPIRLNLPEDYLSQEVRCDFLVTRERKELWAVELDLLNQFDKACKKIGVQYFASGGTALGAVRHNGFIPWDDDIDLYVFRKDYNKLCHQSDKLFDDPYFFQTEWTDPGSIRGHAQLRNSKTTAILNTEKDSHYGFNQGIFIDIFPIDNIPNNTKEREKLFKRLVFLKKMARQFAELTLRRPASLNKVKYTIKKTMRFFASPFFLMHRMDNPFYKAFEDAAQVYNEISCKDCGEIVFEPGKGNTIFDRSYFDDVQYVPFEMLEIPVPTKYDEILTKQYGDWRKVVKAESDHGGFFFDAHRSYKEYL